MAVITVTRGLGSGGDIVALQVAERLGIPYLDRSITKEVADEAGVTEDVIQSVERKPNLFQRMLEVLASSPQPVGGLAWATPVPIDTSDTYLQMIDQFIRSVADSGPAVIVGHGAPAILASHPNVLRCLITAPDAIRAARVAEETGLDSEAAKKRIRATDQEWGSFLKNSHNMDWLRTSNYDLVINTGRMPFEAAVNLIVEAASSIG